MLSAQTLCVAVVCIALAAGYPQRDGRWMREQDYPGLYFQKPQEFGDYPRYHGDEILSVQPNEERFYGPRPQFMRSEPHFMERPQYHPHQGPFPHENWRGEPERFDHFGRGRMHQGFPGFQGFRGFREPGFQHFQQPSAEYEIAGSKRTMDSADKATKAEAGELKKM
ncbi:hypothetical protein SprV_0702295300 [Sparganum proliferum]